MQVDPELLFWQKFLGLVALLIALDCGGITGRTYSKLVADTHELTKSVSLPN